MILDRLGYFKNFKRFRDEEIKFQDGITGILGNNGTGKSSLVQAIFFALYGVQATGISADYIVSSFASPKEKCEVVLDFRIGGDDVSRSSAPSKKGKTVITMRSSTRTERTAAKGVSQVEAEVKRTLGMGPVDFRNTIYAAQKDLLTLLENTPVGKRKEWFLRALGIDYLKTESERFLKEQIDAKKRRTHRNGGRARGHGRRQSEEELATLQASVKKFHAAIAEHGKAERSGRRSGQNLTGQQKVLAEKKTRVQPPPPAAAEPHKGAGRGYGSRQRNSKTRLALMAEEQAEYDRLRPIAGSHEEVRAADGPAREKKEEFLQLNADLGFAMKQIADLTARAEKQQSA